MTVRHGGGQGFYGDGVDPVADVLDAGVDYLVCEALAELTLAILQKDRQRDERLGFTRDLGLPHVDGFQVLEWLRHHETLRHLIVIVLSGSVFSPDVKRSYSLGANSFLAKPLRLEQFYKTIKSATDFWLESCQLPSMPRT